MPAIVGLAFVVCLLSCLVSVVLLFFRELRFLAIYVLLGGMAAGVSAPIAGFGLPVLVDRWFHSQVLSTLSFFLGLFAGGGLGGIAGLLIAHGLRIGAGKLSRRKTE